MRFHYPSFLETLLRVTTVATFLLANNENVHGQNVGDPLQYPIVHESTNGLLDITLTLEYANHASAAHALVGTRLLDGTLPGPTIKVHPGDTMRILYQNTLQEQQGQNEVPNEFSFPDTTNLHFHGAHVSGELPSDDITLRIPPGGQFQYETHFPANHMPGTHWIHPHVHGSGSLQVSRYVCFPVAEKIYDSICKQSS